MLAYILAIAVGLGSIALYLAAFFYPEIHRKEDFYLSGLGFFYCLVLWVCASRITGGVLLGQIAGVSLLGWFAWQNLTLRRAIAHPGETLEISTLISEKIESLLQIGWVAAILTPIINLFRQPEPEIQSATVPEVATTALPEEETEQERELPSATRELIEEEEAEPPSKTEETSLADALLETEEEAEPPSRTEETSLADALLETEEETEPPSKTEETSLADALLETEEETKPPSKTEEISLADVLFETEEETEPPSVTQKPPETIEEEEFPEIEAEIPSNVTRETLVEAEFDFTERYSTTTSPTQTPIEEEADEIDDFLFGIESQELEAHPPKPPTPEAVEAARQAETKSPLNPIDIEEIAPEAELAPPAEPLGEGDPSDRQTLQETTEETPKKKLDRFFDFDLD
jgi:Ycf66 protein N-terminus